MRTPRRKRAMNVRSDAAEFAAKRPHPRHIANGDEQKFRHTIVDACSDTERSAPSYLTSFTKGLAHNEKTGLVRNPVDFQQLVRAIDSGNARDFQTTPLGPIDKSPATRWFSEKAKAACEGKGANVRAWEIAGGELTYELEGPDAQAVTMPPAPVLGSDELTAEMAEVYAQALLRDIPFTDITAVQNVRVKRVIHHLNKLNWIKDSNCCSLTEAERGRKRKTTRLDGQTAFRGITPGDTIGPYISQFLLAGSRGLGDEFQPNDGMIAYGAVAIDQRVRYASPYEDYMTNWAEWLDVQQGADLRGLERYESQVCPTGKTERRIVTRRFITTPRDLSTYVHYDALYEAYLNTCLVLLREGVPFDPDIPFQRNDEMDHQQGFTHFSGPHILSLVTAVAIRALRAVRFQKYSVHRRFRPEALAGHLANRANIDDPSSRAILNQMVNQAPGLKEILKMVAEHNGTKEKRFGHENFLLPMAYCEGSPMHPSYGAGHSAVAGACVTILKAFFDHNHPLTLAGSDTRAFVPDKTGCRLEVVNVQSGALTVEGELNKLASNVSIGRDWAGVHFFSEYIESLRLGEQIAIGMLEEQKLTYGETFSMTVPLYDGGVYRI